MKSGEEKKRKKEKEKRRARQKLRLMGSSLCVYLQKCHHNSVSITWKHLKYVFSFHNSSLKIKELSDGNKNWKHPQTHFSAVGPTIFELWVMKIELWVMEIQKPNSPLLFRFLADNFEYTLPSLFFGQKALKYLNSLL